MAYTTNTALKTYLGLTTSGDDTLLTTLIANAQAAIDKHCRQTFEAEDDSTRYFDAMADVDGPDLYLDAPLCAITTITNGDGTTVAGTKYVTAPRNSTPWWKLTLKTNAGISWTYSTTPENAISIEGKWAYSASAPDDIVQACLLLAGYLYRRRNNALDLDRAVVVSDAIIQPLSIPRDVLTLLRPYKRLV